MTCLRCHHTTVKKFGTYGKRRIQRYRCHHCSATFSVTGPKIANHLLSLDKAAQVIKLMVEGMSIRAISRITGTDQNTIMSLLLTVGHRCRNIFNNRIHGIKANYVELDELWCFVHTKEKRLHEGDPAEWGDAYTWIGLDAETKLMISYLVAKRDGPRSLTALKDSFYSQTLNVPSGA